MADYTITVYDLEKAGFDFGLDHYTIFNEAYRPSLNKAILDFYRFREIGYTNPSQWRERLITRLDRIMRDKYNALYEVKQIEFNPLYNIDITETFERVLDGVMNAENVQDGKDTQTNVNNAKNESSVSNNVKETTSEIGVNSTTENGDNLVIQSTYPSEELTQNDLTNNIYADSANKNTVKNSSQDSTNQTTTHNNTNSTTVLDENVNESQNISNSVLKNNMYNDRIENEKYSKTTKGSSAGLPFSKAMEQFKGYCDKFQLDRQVIDELKDLFITLW